MYVLNITTSVENKIAPAWLHWVRERYIPSLMETNCFDTYKFHKLLGQDESESQTFVLQLISGSERQHTDFMVRHKDLFSKRAFEQWGESAFEFCSVLQNIE